MPRGRPVVAIVGTRRPSPYGREVAYALGRGLGAAGSDRGQRARARHRRRRPPRLPRRPRGPWRCWRTDRTSPIRDDTGALHAPVAERGVGGVGAAAGPARVALELPGAQPDHGRRWPGDRGGGGGRTDGEPDHGRLRRRSGADGGRRAGPGHRPGGRRARNGLLRDGAAVTSSRGRAGRADAGVGRCGPRRPARAADGLAAPGPCRSGACWRRWRRAGRARTSAAAPAPASEVRGALARLEAAGLVRGPARRLLRRAGGERGHTGRGERPPILVAVRRPPPRCCRSPARTRGRRGHPGRPEGVRRLRGSRHDRDHGDHRAEHERR